MIDCHRGDMVEASWGQQIRNYVFHPYKLVKDTRTGQETAQVQDVMDGNLDDMIEAYLRYARGMVGSEQTGNGADGRGQEQGPGAKSAAGTAVS